MKVMMVERRMREGFSVVVRLLMVRGKRVVRVIRRVN
jgi:hypothetical protein